MSYPGPTNRWPGAANSPTRCGSATAQRPNELLLRDPSLVGDAARKFIHYPGGHNEGFPDTFKQCFRAFYEAIRSGNPTAGGYPSFADGHREIVLCEAILKSHQERSWVQVQGAKI